MKTIKKVNQSNSIDHILFKNGGNTVPSAVGTNRSYGQVIKENIEGYLDKLKGNPFAEMLFPFEDVSEGRTEAMIPYIVPGYGVVKQSAKGIKNMLKRGIKVGETSSSTFGQRMNRYQNYLKDYNDSLNRNARDLYQHDNYNKRIQQDIQREKQLENKIDYDHYINELETIDHFYGDTDSYYPHLAEFYRHWYGENSKQYKNAWKKVLQIFGD